VTNLISDHPFTFLALWCFWKFLSSVITRHNANNSSGLVINMSEFVCRYLHSISFVAKALFSIPVSIAVSKTEGSVFSQSQQQTVWTRTWQGLSTGAWRNSKCPLSFRRVAVCFSEEQSFHLTIKPSGDPVHPYYFMILDYLSKFPAVLNVFPGRQHRLVCWQFASKVRIHQQLAFRMRLIIRLWL